MKKVSFSLFCLIILSAAAAAQYVTIPNIFFRQTLQLKFSGCFNVSGQMDTTCSQIVDEDSLTLPLGQTISNLEGIQYFKSLKYLDCSSIGIQIIPKLPAELQQLNCKVNNLTSLPPLPLSLQELECSRNSLNILPILPSKLRWLRCGSNQISSLPLLPDSLTVLTCFSNQLQNLPPLPPNLTILECYSNQLQSLPPLPPKLINLYCYSNQLQNLPALPDSLKELRCYNNQLQNLPLIPPVLKILECLNNQIQSIPQLPFTLTRLNANNNKLTSLPALPDTLFDLYVASNNIRCLPILPRRLFYLDYDTALIHCIPNVPRPGYVLYKPGSPSVLIKLPLCNPTNNVNGCHAKPFIEGSVFFDQNLNGVKDNNEFFRTGAVINLSKGGYGITNDSGFYQISADTTGPLKLWATAPIYCKAVPDTVNYNFITYDTIVTRNIAIRPLVNKDSLSITAIPITTRARPGRPYSYLITWQNEGTTDLSPSIVKVGFDNQLLDYVGSSNASVSLSGNTLSMNLATLPFGGRGHLTIDFTVKISAALGDTICNIASIAHNTLTATAEVCNRITGSYDPNDKEATPEISKTEVATGHYIDYTIRFQNTGTDTAFIVVIEDTLRSGLQFNTLQVLSSSHSCNTLVKNGIAYFEFKNILLPDSNVNESASHGFVHFRMKPELSLAFKRQVQNRAAIYFDYNKPVMTNSAITLVKEPGAICKGSNAVYNSGYSNASSYQWEESTGGEFVPVTNGVLYTGANANTLTISNPSTSFLNYRYRCKVGLGGGTITYSQVFTLSFAATWTGAVSTTWENAANWSCGVVPDVNTDVVIKAGTPYTPAVNVTANVRSIMLSFGANVMVKAGVALNVEGGQNIAN